MNNLKWDRLHDWGSDDLLDMRLVKDRMFQFILIDDMEAACGRDNEDHPKYHASLSLVDLSVIPEKEGRSAIESCGCDEEEYTDEALAEICHSYGLRAPLWQESSNNWNKLLRAARQEANSLLDQEALDTAMKKPVNDIGSTADEFMRGDIYSGLDRGIMAGNQNARLMGKMYGVDQQVLDDARPKDWLPYFVGYTAAINNGAKEEDDDLAETYRLGWERGVNVREGKAPAPGWIKEGKT